MVDRYEPSPRHKRHPARGRKGRICPDDVDGHKLFQQSILDPNSNRRRFATDGNRAFMGRCTDEPDALSDDRDVLWHGYQVEWGRVPADVQRHWVATQQIQAPNFRMEY
jgi:hypothetical protein